MERKIRISKVTYNPVENQERDINQDPQELFNRAEKEGALLGTIPFSQVVAIANKMPYVSTAPCAHFMLAPRTGNFETFSSLQHAEGVWGKNQWAIARSMHAFLYSKNHEDLVLLTGFNQSSDRRLKRGKDGAFTVSLAQSWANFHAHFLRFPLKSQEIEELPLHKRRQIVLKGLHNAPVYENIPLGMTHTIEQILFNTFAEDGQLKGAVVPGSRVIAPSEFKYLPFYTSGSLVIEYNYHRRDRYTHSPQPAHILSTMSTLFQNYAALHEHIYSALISNYQEVKESGWQLPYTLRSEKERGQYLDTLPLDEHVKTFLYNLPLKNEEDITAISRLIARSPSFTFGFIRMPGEGGPTLHGVFKPIISHRGGFMESFGFLSRRQSGVVSEAEEKERNERARAMFKELQVNVRVR